MSITKDSASLPYIPFQHKPREYEKVPMPDFTDYIAPGYTGYIPNGRDFEGLSFTSKIRAAKASSPAKSPKSPKGEAPPEAAAAPASPSAAAAPASPSAAAASPKSPKPYSPSNFPPADKSSPIPGYAGHVPQHNEVHGMTYGNLVAEARRVAAAGSPKSPTAPAPPLVFDKRHCAPPPHPVDHSVLATAPHGDRHLPSGYTGHLHGTANTFGRPYYEIATAARLQYSPSHTNPNLQPGATGSPSLRFTQSGASTGAPRLGAPAQMGDSG